MKHIKTFKFEVSNYVYHDYERMVKESPGYAKRYAEAHDKLWTVERIDEHINDWFFKNGITEFCLKSVFPITTERHNNGCADWVELCYVFEY